MSKKVMFFAGLVAGVALMAFGAMSFSSDMAMADAADGPWIAIGSFASLAAGVVVLVGSLMFFAPAAFGKDSLNFNPLVGYAFAAVWMFLGLLLLLTGARIPAIVMMVFGVGFGVFAEQKQERS